MYAANENIECDVYIPRGEVLPGKLSQAFQFGAQVIQVDGNFDDALTASLAEVTERQGYTVNSVNPFRLEGQKAIVYRVMEHLKLESARLDRLSWRRIGKYFQAAVNVLLNYIDGDG